VSNNNFDKNAVTSTIQQKELQEKCKVELVQLQKNLSNAFKKLQNEVANSDDKDSQEIIWYKADQNAERKLQSLPHPFQGWKVADIKTQSGRHHTGASIHDEKDILYVTKNMFLLVHSYSENAPDGDEKLIAYDYIAYSPKEKTVQHVYQNCDYVNRHYYSREYSYGDSDSDGIAFLRRILNATNTQKEETSNATNNSNAKNNGGCYIATAVYGSYNCPEVYVLRRFRDNILRKNCFGKGFIALYYKFSPTLVKHCIHMQWFTRFWKGTLDKLVKALRNKDISDAKYDD